MLVERTCDLAEAHLRLVKLQSLGGLLPEPMVREKMVWLFRAAGCDWAGECIDGVPQVRMDHDVLHCMSSDDELRPLHDGCLNFLYCYRSWQMNYLHVLHIHFPCT